MELTRYSKDGSRALSPFHAREMLYEYACGNLDRVRAQALEDYLKTDPDLQAELQRLRRALDYLQGLSDFRVSPEKIAQLRVSTTWFDRTFEKLRLEDWPPGLKLGLESLAVVSAIFVIAIAIPWNTLFEVIQDETGSTILAEIRRDFRSHGSEDEYSEDSLMEMVKGIVFDDEGTPESESKRRLGQIAAVPQLAAPSGGSTLPPSANVQPEAQPVKRTTSSVESPSAERPVEAVIAKAEPAATPLPAPTATTAPVAEKTTSGTKDPLFNQGFLYRGKLRATNVQAITPKLVEYVTALGGRKAGQVELGWSKGQGSYFHFTIPEAKYEELVKFFREYGTLAISKERHSKLMPEGIIRLIVEVEEKNP